MGDCTNKRAGDALQVSVRAISEGCHLILRVRNRLHLPIRIVSINGRLPRGVGGGERLVLSVISVGSDFVGVLALRVEAGPGRISLVYGQQIETV